MRLIIFGPISPSSLSCLGGTSFAATTFKEFAQSNIGFLHSLQVVNILRNEVTPSSRSTLKLAFQVLFQIIALVRYRKASYLYFHSSINSSPRLLLVCLLASLTSSHLHIFFRSGKDIQSYQSANKILRLVFLSCLRTRPILLFQTSQYAQVFTRFFYGSVLRKTIPPFHVLLNWTLPVSRLSYDASSSMRQQSFQHPTFIIASNLLAHKRVESSFYFLHELQKSFPFIRLLICGDGPLYASLAHLASRILSNYTFYGHLAYEDLSALYAQSHFFLSFSEVEGLSNSLIQAMSHGCVPVISAPSLVHPLTKPGLNAITVDQSASESVPTALSSLLKSYSHYHSFSIQAYQSAGTYCSLEQNCSKLIEILL